MSSESSSVRILEGKNVVALITGATRGVGKGIALGLAEMGCAVIYITGRSQGEFEVEKRLPGSLAQTASEVEALGARCIPVVCDHSQDDQTQAVIERIQNEQQRLDILVNNAFCVPKPSIDFFTKPFWDQTPQFLDDQYKVGLRNHLVASKFACPLLFQSPNSLIINISSAGGQLPLFCVSYQVIKAAIDRMSQAMAKELKEKGVSCVSLWPGVVKTERMVAGANLMGGLDFVNSQGESPQFVGRVVAALYADPDRLAQRSGKTWSTRKLAQEYNVVDVNGKAVAIVPDQEPRPLADIVA